MIVTAELVQAVEAIVKHQEPLFFIILANQLSKKISQMLDL
ncbi:MAG: hypothetical protein BWY54_00572 [Candidatus Dependentiae bacterium ADurb.Bin331]|nr:MAG: hypothetical protein BWY54_00572 [Candidatus Dependentiae bacterium ADurb.Bin331]